MENQMQFSKNAIKSAISAFLNSEGFLVLYSAFVLIFSFLGNNAVTLSVILLTLAVIFFTQKNLRPIFVPLTLSYFALTFIDGEFKLNWLFYLSATVFVVSLVYYIVANRPKLFLTTNLKALLPYGAAYVLAGSFAANYMQNKIYHQQIALLLLVVAAFLLLSLIAANSEFDGPEFVFKVIFALGVVVGLQCCITALVTEDFLEEVFLKDLFHTNWGVYNGVITVFLFTIPASFYLAVKYSRYAYIFVLAGFLQFAAGHLTASRAAFLALTPFLLVCFAATLAVCDKRKRRRVAAAFLMSLGVLIAVCVVIALLNAEFVKDLFSVFASSGFDLGRAGIWKDSIAFFLENPLFGLGLIHHEEIQQAAISYLWMSHNTILQALSSLGIVGFTGLMIHSFIKYKTFLKRDYFSFFALIMIIATELYGLIDCLMPAPYYLMPLLLLLISADRIKDDNKEKIPLRSQLK